MTDTYFLNKLASDSINPTTMHMLVKYSYTNNSTYRRNFIGDVGTFVIYDNGSETVMICHNKTADKFICKRAKLSGSSFYPTEKHFWCAAFNMCFSDIRGTRGMRHNTQMTFISDAEQVNRIRPFFEELVNRFDNEVGKILYADNYTALFDSYSFPCLTMTEHGDFYMLADNANRSVDSINKMISEYNLDSGSFEMFNKDCDYTSNHDNNEQEEVDQLSQELDDLLDDLKDTNVQTDKASNDNAVTLHDNMSVYQITVSDCDSDNCEEKFVREENLMEFIGGITSEMAHKELSSRGDNKMIKLTVTVRKIFIH